MANASVAGDTNVHGGAPFDDGLTSNVLVRGKGVAIAGVTGSKENDTLYNNNRNAHPQGIASNQQASGGSSTVFINGKPAHRVGDARKDGATSGPGDASVRIG